MSTISFFNKKNVLYCRYKPLGGTDYISKKLELSDDITIKRIFTVKKDSIYFEGDSDDGSIVFPIGTLVEGYYKLDGSVFNLKNTFNFHRDIQLNIKLFTSVNDTNILLHLDKIIDDDIYIGGGNETHIPTAEYMQLIKSFPNKIELDKYANKRISSIIQDYVNIPKDYTSDYENYLNKKSIDPKKSKDEIEIEDRIYENETEKYKFKIDKLKHMLANDVSYSEQAWSKEINDILTLVFPKYLTVLENVTIKTRNRKDKRLDFVMIDASGYVDVLEIKKSYDKKIMSKSRYRSNFIPSGELSGVIQQVEKYIYHLNQNPATNELKIKCKLPQKMLENDFDIKIRSPRGLIILGTKRGLSEEQLDDFEIIKRKYKNIVDILTYDDLVDILERLINKFKSEVSNT